MCFLFVLIWLLPFVSFSKINKSKFPAAFAYLNGLKYKTSCIAKLFNNTRIFVRIAIQRYAKIKNNKNRRRLGRRLIERDEGNILKI